MTQNNLDKLFHLTTLRSQSTNMGSQEDELKAGTWTQELKQRPMFSLQDFLFYTVLDYLAKSTTTHNRQSPIYISH